jgi:hypothetical protein
MDIGKTRIEAGTVTFALQHRYLDGGAPHSVGGGSRGGVNPTQGVCIQVTGAVAGTPTELLRFDCFDVDAHYHYGPEKKNERIMLDPTVMGNPIGWTIKQLRTRLPAMIERAGYEELARQVDAGRVSQKLEDVEAAARQLAAKGRNNVTHNRGNPVIEAGNIRFGLELRAVGADGGMAIHVLADVAGQEIELLALDCFRVYPHYHYGPRNRNQRVFWDKTLVPDPLAWCLDQFRAGKLPAMIERAGYPDIAAAVDLDLVASKLAEIENTANAMAAAGSG